MADLYAEMYDEGYNPSRGLGPVFAVMVVFAGLAVAMIGLTVITLFTGHLFWVEQVVVRHL
jgi:hypothetical protein